METLKFLLFITFSATSLSWFFLSGWSDGAKVLGKLSVPGRWTTWTIVGQGSIGFAVGAGEGYLDIFFLVCLFSFLFPFLGDGPIETEILCRGGGG